MANNGLNDEISQIASVMWMAAIPMIIGLILAVIVFKKPREYKENLNNKSYNYSS